LVAKDLLMVCEVTNSYLGASTTSFHLVLGLFLKPRTTLLISAILQITFICLLNAT
jgi:hypothetical protein